MKKLLLIVFLFGLVSTVAAQEPNTGASGSGPCKLRLPQAPVIRGIRLGMTATEAMAVFPGAEKDEALRRRLSEPRFGVVNADLNPATYESREKFVGVRSVHIGFLDGELNFFTVMYNGPEWKSDEQFASKVAETLNLPGVEFWTHKTHFGKALACDGFEVVVQKPTESSVSMIQIRNLGKDVNRIVREREEAVKNEARRAFKP